MNQELNLYLESIMKFIKKEFSEHISSIDLYPAKPLPFDPVERLSKIIAAQDMDRQFFTLSNTGHIVYTISLECAGLGTIVGEMLTGEFMRKLFAPEIPPQRIAIAIYENNMDSFDSITCCKTTLKDNKINGQKNSVLLAPLADAFAVLTSNPDGNHLAFVKKSDAEVQSPAGLTGIRAVPCGDVMFSNATPFAIRKIKRDEIMYILSMQAFFYATSALATATRALSQAWEYALERYQGGTFISNYDAIRLLYEKNLSRIKTHERALFALAENLTPGSEGIYKEIIQTKIAVNESSVNATMDAIQMLGGYGYMRDYGIEKRFRDAVALSLLPLDSTRLSMVID